MTQPEPLPEQQLEELTAIAARAADDPFYVSDCEGSLQVWREKALTHVRRDEHGVIDMYSFPSTYKVTDQVIELDLSTWDPGEDATDDQQRQDINDLVEARAALNTLLAELDRRGAALTEMTHCRDTALRALYRDDVETDIDLEETIAAPFYGPGWDWDEQALADVVKEAAGAIRPAFGKLTQERDHLRQQLAAVEALCDEQEKAARMFEFSAPAWVRAVRAAVQATPEPAPVPLPASQPSEAPVEGETATEAPTGRVGDSGAGSAGGTR